LSLSLQTRRSFNVARKRAAFSTPVTFTPPKPYHGLAKNKLGCVALIASGEATPRAFVLFVTSKILLHLADARSALSSEYFLS
jgi:hypothetical protein